VIIEIHLIHIIQLIHIEHQWVIQ